MNIKTFKMVSLLLCFVLMMISLPLSESELNIKTIYHWSIKSNIVPAKGYYVRCHLMDPVLIWLDNALSLQDGNGVDNPDSFLLERDCPNGYYLLATGERYCRNDCSENTSCGPIPVPDDYLKPCNKCDRLQGCQDGKEINNRISNTTQFVLHIAAMPTALCELTGLFVHGGTCLQHKETDRPIVGYLNFCINDVNRANEHSDYDMQVMQIIHEMLKILAFSHELLPFFRNPSTGQPYMPRNQMGFPPFDHDGHYGLDFMLLTDYIYYNWTSRRNVRNHFTKIITLPNVVQKAKEHFNCSSIKGFPLEDQSNGRMLWEQRIMMGDIMTATWLTRPVISEITLALFEDSGWYKVNYNYAGVLNWGEGMGCEFITDSCQKAAMTIGSHSFCDFRPSSNTLGCTVDYKAVASCVIKTYPRNLPREFQYLHPHLKKVGGPLPEADYCPMYHVVSSETEFCSHGSMCFQHIGNWQVTEIHNRTVTNIPVFIGAGCYKVECKSSRLLFTIGKRNITCYSDNEVKNITIRKDGMQINGSIKCPPYKRFCQAFHCVNDCHDKGRCIDGYCYCYPGYYGEDCRMMYTHRYMPFCNKNWCINYPSTYKRNSCGCYCQCPDWIGTTGYHCNQRKMVIDKCKSRGCSENGRCVRVNRGKNRRCICNAGYEGKKCDQKIKH